MGPHAAKHLPGCSSRGLLQAVPHCSNGHFQRVPLQLRILRVAGKYGEKNEVPQSVQCLCRNGTASRGLRCEEDFHFVDDMFNLSRSRVKQFCQILESKRWGISYTFPNGLRLNTIDQDMLSCLKKTGSMGSRWEQSPDHSEYSMR